jgi:hypothetical protein
LFPAKVIAFRRGPNFKGNNIRDKMATPGWLSRRDGESGTA